MRVAEGGTDAGAGSGPAPQGSTGESSTTADRTAFPSAGWSTAGTSASAGPSKAEGNVDHPHPLEDGGTAAAIIASAVLIVFMCAVMGTHLKYQARRSPGAPHAGVGSTAVGLGGTMKAEGGRRRPASRFERLGGLGADSPLRQGFGHARGDGDGMAVETVGLELMGGELARGVGGSVLLGGGGGGGAPLLGGAPFGSAHHTGQAALHQTTFGPPGSMPQTVAMQPGGAATVVRQPAHFAQFVDLNDIIKPGDELDTEDEDEDDTESEFDTDGAEDGLEGGAEGGLGHDTDGVVVGGVGGHRPVGVGLGVGQRHGGLQSGTTVSPAISRTQHAEWGRTC